MTVDPDLLLHHPQINTGPVQVEHPVESYLETPHEAFCIEAGAVWDLTDTPTHTAVCLTDCDDPRLRGLEVEVDWTQGLASRPEILQQRFETIVLDTELLTHHLMENHLPRLSSSAAEEKHYTLSFTREQLIDLQNLLDEGCSHLEDWERYLAGDEPDPNREALLSRASALIRHVSEAGPSRRDAQPDMDFDMDRCGPPTRSTKPPNP